MVLNSQNVQYCFVSNQIIKIHKISVLRIQKTNLVNTVLQLSNDYCKNSIKKWIQYHKIIIYLSNEMLQMLQKMFRKYMMYHLNDDYNRKC